MFVHTVFFWLKPELSEEQRADFRQGLDSLQAIEVAQSVHMGTPAESNRPVIDRSYTLGLTVLLDNAAAHDTYQVHPLHKAFVERFNTFWEKLVVYDFE